MKPGSRHFALSLALTLLFYYSPAQQKTFTRQDTLRGSIGPARNWWDVLRYDITVHPDYYSKTIRGITKINFKVKKSGNEKMQIDLQYPMQIDSFYLDGKKRFNKSDIMSDFENKNHFINAGSLKAGSIHTITLFFSGKPREAVRPPWDGGWIWRRDKMGSPWMSVACQGLGSSVWFPCKDHQSDEPDNGASLSIIVPDTLIAIANGRLKEKKTTGQLSTYTWEVKNPINNYNIIPYIGKYVNWTETYNGEKGKLDCSYWVLDYELERAKKQFETNVKPMLKAFEHWFGPYPFYEDGFKMVQSPHLGMEHQSAIAYGNDFQNGYRGTDLSGSGWGLKWDFIIIHEAGHEWFGNNITTNDIADMWVHESFTNYSETLFTDYYYGKEAGNDYCIGTRKNIQNDIPIIGPYGVNQEGSGDMYYKGGNMLHTIRYAIGNDEKFRQILRGLNKDFYHQTVNGRQIEEYISRKSGIDFSKVFDQYLRTTRIPVLEYKISGNKLLYRWTNCVKGFNLKIKTTDGKWLHPSEQWKEMKAVDNFSVDRNFYINTKKVE